MGGGAPEKGGRAAPPPRAGDSSWIVPRGVACRTIEALSGRDAEAFALWTEPLPPARGRRAISRVVVPAQEPGAGASGERVHVPGGELRRIAFANHERGERCAAQIHTHPSSDTRMSALDAEWEVVTHAGALSIIVPDYCRGGIASFAQSSVYEREEGGRWRLWGAGELERRLRIQ